jgi:hypothetical protein
MDIPKTFSEKVYYLSARFTAIERNRTSDVFCSLCFQATEKAETSHCCQKPVLEREQALSKISEIRERIRVR